MKVTRPQDIDIVDYHYNLPENRIARYPLEKRDNSKLLIYQNGKIQENIFSTLPEYIPENSLMIFNNTKVIQARLRFFKPTGAQIEIFCLEPYIPHDYLLSLQANKNCSWHCLIGNLKKWKEGELSKIVKINGNEICLTAKKTSKTIDNQIIEFTWNNESISFSDILESGGELPIPPYLNRETEENDKKTYQTVYSKIKGSVAAPTAGLHFTDNTFTELKHKGVKNGEITLHVGAGTFKPVKTDKIGGHRMHSEFISVPKQIISDIINHKGKIIAVGTTSVRTLESLYYIGMNIEYGIKTVNKVEQWQPYELNQNKISPEKALQNILSFLEKNKLDYLFADTQIMIVPGYEFKIVKGIVTNFHQPQSTLLLLVSAFVDGNWQKIYSYAMEKNFRFLSYGDSSLLLK